MRARGQGSAEELGPRVPQSHAAPPGTANSAPPSDSIPGRAPWSHHLLPNLLSNWRQSGGSEAGVRALGGGVARHRPGGGPWSRTAAPVNRFRAGFAGRFPPAKAPKPPTHTQGGAKRSFGGNQVLVLSRGSGGGRGRGWAGGSLPPSLPPSRPVCGSAARGRGPSERDDRRGRGGPGAGEVGPGPRGGRGRPGGAPRGALQGGAVAPPLRPPGGGRGRRPGAGESRAAPGRAGKE